GGRNALHPSPGRGSVSGSGPHPVCGGRASFGGRRAGGGLGAGAAGGAAQRVERGLRPGGASAGREPGRLAGAPAPRSIAVVGRALRGCGGGSRENPAIGGGGRLLVPT